MLKYVSLFLIGLAPVTAAVAQRKPSLQGAWRIAEVTTTGPRGATNRNPLPSLYLFTATHYSITREEGTTPRAAGAISTDTIASLRNMLRFAAQAGTYKVAGDELILDRVVALGLGHMGNSSTSIIRIVGDTVWITQKSNERGPLQYPTTYRIQRVQ